MRRSNERDQGQIQFPSLCWWKHEQKLSEKGPIVGEREIQKQMSINQKDVLAKWPKCPKSQPQGSCGFLPSQQNQGYEKSRRLTVNKSNEHQSQQKPCLKKQQTIQLDDQMREQHSSQPQSEQMLFYCDQLSSLSPASNSLQVAREQHQLHGNNLEDQSRLYSHSGLTYFNSPSQFEMFVKDFQQSNFTFMLPKQVLFCKEFDFMLQHWAQYRYSFQGVVKLFLDVTSQKITDIAYSSQIYPRLSLLVIKASIILNYQADGRYLQRDGGVQKDIDILYQHFINMLSTKGTRKGKYCINKQGEERLSLLEECHKDPHYLEPLWQQVFFKVVQSVKSDQQFNQLFALEQTIKASTNRVLYQTPTVNTANILSASFFYSKSNIYNYLNDECPISLGGPITKLDTQRAGQFLSQFVGLLNAGGGIMLFDTIHNYYTIETIGEFILQHQKHTYSHFINKLVTLAKPKVFPGVDFSIEFIPVARLLAPQPPKSLPSFRDGFYVTAIKVFKQPHRSLYGFESDGGFKFYLKRYSVIPSQQLQCQARRREWVSDIRNENGSYLQLMAEYVQREGDRQKKMQIMMISEGKRKIESQLLPELEPLYEKQSQRQENFRFNSLKHEQHDKLSSLYRQLTVLNKEALCEVFEPHIGNNQEQNKEVILILRCFQKCLQEEIEYQQKVNTLYRQDLKCVSSLESNQPFSKTEVDQHYQPYYSVVQSKVNLLSLSWTVLIEHWKNVYFFKNVYLEEDPPLEGAPLTQRQPLALQPAVDIQQSFSQFSLLVCQFQDLSALKEKFNKYNIDCGMCGMPNKKLRGSTTTFMVGHSISCFQVCEIMRDHKDEFVFNKKEAIVIPITSCIKLTQRTQTNPLSCDQFKELSKWLLSEFPRETLRHWKDLTRQGEVEYYISTGSWMSTVFIYLVLLHLKEKSTLKNPSGVWSRDQIPSRLRPVYPG